MNKTNVQGQGIIAVNDMSQFPANIDIKGYDSQKTREGYNLAKISNYDTTFSGIALKSNLEEGYISATGISTGLSTPVVTATLPVGDYVFSGGPANGSASTQRLSIYKYINEQYSFLSTIWGDNTYTVHVDEETTFRFNYVIPSGTTVNNEKIYPMIVSGTETKPFQVYGVMPSVEYPSEIKTVKDEVNVVVSNKNMFNVPSKNQNGVNLVLQNDGSYLINGTSTASWAFRVGDTIPLEPGDYTFYVESDKPLNQGYFGLQNWRDFKHELGVTAEKHIHLTEPKKVQCYFTCNRGSTFDNVIVKVQLEKSNTKTDWVKHEEERYVLDIQEPMLDGDYFIKESDGWKEVHRWNKDTYDETDNFSVYVLDNVFQFYLPTTISQSASLLCNMFIQKDDWNSTSVVVSSTNYLYFLIRKGEYGFTADLTAEQALTKFKEIIAITNT